MKKLLFTLFIATATMAMTVAEENRIPLIGSKAPSFTLQTTNGQLTFPEGFGNSWKILFSHPQDFTPVCTSELLELAYHQQKFDEMDVKVAVISTDELRIHTDWKRHLENIDYKQRGKQKIHFPIMEDLQAKVSKQYGMLHQPVSTTRDIRGVFIIDANNIIRSVNFYPMEVGRSIEEVLRLVAALKTTDKEKVLAPAEWRTGDDLLMPHFPYTSAQLSADPGIKDRYYSVGDKLWFRKAIKEE